MEKIKDMTGMIFGRLTVIRYAGSTKTGQAKWCCVCECGGEVEVVGYSLRCGNTRSCGCLVSEHVSTRRRIDLTGRRYGRLTVLSIHGKNKRGEIYWLCKCDCGKDTVVLGSKLRYNITKSCGCYQFEAHKKGKGEAAFNKLLRTYIQSAEQRGYEYALSNDEFGYLIHSDCYYCGKPPSRNVKHVSDNGSLIYNGIDRVDNTLGYISSNVVTCCAQCNRAKLNYSLYEFKNWLKTAYEHMKLNEVTI